jgi:hypothetical protein
MNTIRPTIEHVAKACGIAVEAKILAALMRREDAGMIVTRYGDEEAVSTVIREYMNNTADTLAEELAQAAMAWPTAEQLVYVQRRD